MNFELRPLQKQHEQDFKAAMRKSFQLGAEEEFGPCSEEILPEADIDQALQTEGAVACEAVLDGEPVGGVILTIDEKTQHNHLDFLFVRIGFQSRGIGQKIWNKVERMYPETVSWETCTPYFERRNIHFYVNRCGFHIVEYFNVHHPDPAHPEEYSAHADESVGFHGMFRFEKKIKSENQEIWNEQV